MSIPTLVLRYALFAVLATAVNLATQHASLAVADSLDLAMALGTLAGLVAKYLLDDRWIFADPASGLGTHSRKFARYALMGAATTFIFWGTELAFHTLFATPLMRDVGAILGLAIGYVAKYQLDRRFVFLAQP